MEGTNAIDESWLSDGPSLPEQQFAILWADQFPEIDLHTEDKIIPNRKFRFDFTHRPSKTAIEIQGYGPGHNWQKGIIRDQEKIIEAAKHGWQVLQLSSENVEDLRWIYSVKDVIDKRMGEDA